VKAVVCTEHGPPSKLRLLDLPTPAPGPRQVVVTNHAAGVNFPDTLIIQGRYQLKPTLPFSPGAELAGVIKQVGSEVRGFRPGEKVIALPQYGAFAQEVAVDVENLIPLPPTFDASALEAAGSFTLAYGTSLHALQDRARAQSGETLLVLGAAGGVGLAAVELGKMLGLRVIAAASSQEKLEIARRYGADEHIDYSREDLRERVKALTGSRGVDIVYDPVGDKFAEPALRCVGWNGRYLVVGFAAGEIPRIPLNLPLLKGCAVMGVFFGEFVRREPRQHAENLRLLLSWLETGRIRPFISARYPLSQVPQALEALLARKVTGKVIILPQQVD
jgi:NADPH:quinone reductase